MPLRCTTAWRLVALLAALIGSSWFIGPANAADEVAQKIDPKAEKVLRGLADHFLKVNSLSAQLESVSEFQAGGQKGKSEHTYSLAIQRPNRFAAVVLKGDQAVTIVSDGKQLSSALILAKKYTVEDAPAGMPLFGEGAIKLVNAQYGLPVLASLFAAKPYDALLDGVTEVAYVGAEEVEGKKCDHLRFSHQAMDFDLWIETGAKPLIVKFSPDIEKFVKKRQGGNVPPDLKIAAQVLVKNQAIDPALTDEAFKFTVPEGFKKSDGLLPSEPEEPPHPLLNKPAPPITLTQLSGGTFKLASQKDKIVILDFWATWCGPCVRAMPILAEVAAKYKSKGVVLYAVNLEEKADEVSAFLKENKLDISVVLDSDGAVSKAYEVGGIPQSVIIDKTGVVRVVHVGISPNFKDQLVKELDAILAGKNPGEEKKE